MAYVVRNLLINFANLLVEYYSLFFSFVTCVFTILLYIFLHQSLVESFLLSTLTINIGIRGILAFIGNWFTFFSEDIAEKYGWERQNTYQKEIASADGAFAVLGLMSFFLRGDFWTATIIGTSICWILSEIANISSIIKGRVDPSKKLKQDYDVSPMIYFGMYINLLMILFSLIAIAIWKDWITF